MFAAACRHFIARLAGLRLIPKGAPIRPGLSRHPGRSCLGRGERTVPKFISRSDPAAQWTGAHKGHAFFAYTDNYLIDLKAAIIVDVEATRAIPHND
jgi:hypothetical protein